MLGTVSFLLATSVLTQDDEILFTGTGPHTRRVSTTSLEAQKYFDQGLNFMYAFNHGEAKRSFRAATRRDPSCAMAWWGLAMANGPHINNMAVMPEEEKEAFESLVRARSLMSKLRPVDQDLIRAATQRFAQPQPASRASLDRSFATAMRGVWQRHQSDPDVGAIFAESMMNLRPWDLWTHDYKPQPGTQEVVRTLERVMRLNPNHPLGLHLYIHAVEASPNPERAVGAAERLRRLQPSLGHNVHMPTHIDVRVGEWFKAVKSNADAIEADRVYRAARPDQFVYRVYMAHNYHMLAFAAMMTGQRDKAVSAVDEMVAAMPADFKEQAAPVIDGFIAMPIEVRKRFGMWDDLLAVPDHPAHFPLARSMRFAARAKAFAAKGMKEDARREQASFYNARRAIPKEQVFGQNKAIDLAIVATHLMNAEILIAEGSVEPAINHLREGVRREDMLRFSEPPDWIQPTRHTLGALLIRERRFKDALDVYNADLRKLPNNGWSLYGRMVALQGLGRDKEAQADNGRFAKWWASADLPITSSCLCIPGK